jgi:1-phosphofructokinase family hexose kinase
MILIVGPSPALQRIYKFKDFRQGRVNRATQTDELASGKGGNCARAIRNLDPNCPVSLPIPLGGPAGDQILKLFSNEGIRCFRVPISVNTRVCTTILDIALRKTTELVQESPPLASAELKNLEKAILKFLPKSSVLVCTGSLPVGVPDEWYRDLIQEAARRKIPSIIDAQGRPLLKSLEANPFLVKPNLTELQATLASTRDRRSPSKPKSLIRKLHENGARWVLVSNGPRLVTLGHPEHGFWICNPPSIRVRNPIGSGDSLLGGLAWKLSRWKNFSQDNLEQILSSAAFAIGCAGANASGEGYGRIGRIAAQKLSEKLIWSNSGVSY